MIKSEFLVSYEVISQDPNFDKFLSLSKVFIPQAKRRLDYAIEIMAKVKLN